MACRQPGSGGARQRGAPPAGLPCAQPCAGAWQQPAAGSLRWAGRGRGCRACPISGCAARQPAQPNTTTSPSLRPLPPASPGARLLFCVQRPAPVVHQAPLAPHRRQPPVRVVGPQQQAVPAAGGGGEGGMGGAWAIGRWARGAAAGGNRGGAHAGAPHQRRQVAQAEPPQALAQPPGTHTTRACAPTSRRLLPARHTPARTPPAPPPPRPLTRCGW